MTLSSNSANGAMLSPQATQIEVGSGRFVDVLYPDPSTIELEDIARALGFTCRYGGHVKRFYSVAEHALLVHDLLAHQGAGDVVLLAGLFHDAAEAFLGDVVAPLKFAQRAEEFDYPFAIHRASTLGDFRGAYAYLSDRMDRAVAERFGLDAASFEADQVRLADMWALKIEAAELTHSGGAEWRWPGDLPNEGKAPFGIGDRLGMEPDYARRRWLRAARVLLASPSVGDGTESDADA